ncbi:MAG: hypothetical protein Q9218_002688 [Villophora microphyllina]
MAPLLNGYTNGASHHLPEDPSIVEARFSDIPSQIDIPVNEQDTEEAVEVNLAEVLDDPTELCTLLEQEGVSKHYWMVIALAYAKQAKVDYAIEILSKALGTLNRGNPKEKLGPLSLTCWLHLWKSRQAPRMVPDGQPLGDTRVKEDYLKAATATLNEASRINPAFPPLFLARGVLNLLRASLPNSAKSATSGPSDLNYDRVETLKQAIKYFEDSLRVSAGRNMMAVMGRARAYYSLGKYADALEGYQEVLVKKPNLQDPDPRIGIGCCLWQLGHRDEAHEAWERALEINPDSKIANILLGLYYIHESSQYATTDPAFGPTYKKAMTVYTQKAFKLDKELPLTCATFGNYFMMRKSWPTVESLSRKAIELTDVNAVASDGWYLLARKEHYQDRPDLTKAAEYYGKAEGARSGDKGYLPARFGIIQILILQRDLDNARFRLEKMIQQTKSIEAMMILGALHAEDIFRSQASGIKEDKSAEIKKATALLEAVRLAWKDSSKKLTPDSSVLVYLARLYEADQPEKSLQCLLQVEQMTINDLPDKDNPPEGLSVDSEEWQTKLREQLSPQLLNNIGCLYSHPSLHQSTTSSSNTKQDPHTLSLNYFQTALNACIHLGEHSPETIDTDALVTTISYNLARTHETTSPPQLDSAKQIYQGLLARHADYTDARTRLAYIALQTSPHDEGPKAIAALHTSDPSNLEVRALYGWYLSRSKKRAQNIAEDPEQRHYKHTLQQHDKHDRYALTGMGNLYLLTAREMRRDTDADKQKRSKTYEKAVEFFDKALQLDGKNAYAAMGVAIALVEDKRDMAGAVQVFSKVRETLGGREASVFVNLGHCFAELKQYSRAIESYEAALTHSRSSDPQLLACLGRVHLLKGKSEKSPSAIQTALTYSHRALALAPQQIHFQFNIAFVQIQLAQLLYILPETQRSLDDVVKASQGLEEAIESFGDIAASKNPPYPRHDIEQRANMGRNTMRRQLERAVQSQREYEDKNAAKLQEARELREAEIRRREEERRKLEERREEERQKIREERDKMAALSRELAGKRAEEERAREEAEFTTDTDGERVKRTKKKKGGKRKKKMEDASGSETEAGDATGKTRKKKKDESSSSSAEETAKPKKKLQRKRLARKGGKENNFKSQEMVVESESEGERPSTTANAEDGDIEMRDLPQEEGTAVRRKRNVRRISDDEDEDDEDGNERSKKTTAEIDAEEEEGEPRGDSFADNPHGNPVDESVGAAGGAEAGEYADPVFQM